MAVSLSIKNVPDKLAKRLRKQAALHHRSVQGELLVILEDALGRPMGPLSIAEVRRRISKLNLHTPDEGTRMIREDRDAR